jgi:hypothetical protein
MPKETNYLNGRGRRTGARVDADDLRAVPGRMIYSFSSRQLATSRLKAVQARLQAEKKDAEKRKWTKDE